MNDLYVIGFLPLCRAPSLFSSSLQSMRAISGVKAAPEAVELCANLVHNLEPHALPLPHYQVGQCGEGPNCRDWDKDRRDQELPLVIAIGPSASIREKSQPSG